MKKKWNQFCLYFSKNVRWQVIVLVFGVGLFFSLLSFSYALYTIRKEQTGVLNMFAGTLSYTITNEEMINHTVTVSEGSVQSFDFLITSNNPIETEYILYYENALPEGVTVCYVMDTGETSGTIGSYDSSKHVVVVVRNETDEPYSISFGVQGGLLEKPFSLKANRYEITQVFALTQEYLPATTFSSFTVPVSGYYKVELWGAQGRTMDRCQPLSVETAGLGAYTSGYIYLNAGEQLYFYVPQRPYSNGNATDLRLVSGAFDDFPSLYSRIMVAGGGGFGDCWEESSIRGGDGGGLVGGTGEEFYFPQFPLKRKASGGRQSHGGLGGLRNENSDLAEGADGVDGAFGTSSDQKDTAGGGYYFGGSNGWDSGHPAGAGGGSSYIAGYAGVNSVSADVTKNENPTHTNQTLHYSGKYFLDGQMEKGVNDGDGKAKITYVGQSYEKKHTKLNQVRYIKDCINGNIANSDNHWMELQAIKDGVNVAYQKSVTGTTTLMRGELIVDGIMDDGGYAQTESGNQCITVDLGQAYDLDEIAVWHYYEDERTYYDHEMSVSNDNQHWTTVIKDSAQETSEGKRVNAWNDIVIQSETITVGQTYDFGTSNHMQTFTVPESGVYKIETWGGKGRTETINGSYEDVLGGNGGYNSGLIYLPQALNLYIYAYEYSVSNPQFGNGGGAADIRLIAGEYDEVNSLRSRIMVAGGGGTGNVYQQDLVPGGAGGGLVGGAGTTSSVGGCTLGSATGGTQLAGGQGSITDTGTCAGLSGSDGAFGIGGIYAGQSSGSGGDGYYGGGAHGFSNGIVSSGGGGSSFISNYAGCVATTKTGGMIASNVHYSGMRFFQTIMKQGIWEGSAQVKITFVSR